MTQASDRGVVAVERLFSLYGGSAVTYAQGSTSFSVTDAVQEQIVRGGSDGLDQIACTWKFRNADLSVTPSPGDTITDASSLVWRVANDPGSVRQVFFGAAWAVDTVRQRSRGNT